MLRTISSLIRNKLKVYTEKCLEANGDFKTNYSCSACAQECRELKTLLDNDAGDLELAIKLKTGAMTWAQLKIQAGQDNIREALGLLKKNRGKIK